MSSRWDSKYMRIFAAAVLALSMTVLSACGQKSGATASAGPTARGSLSAAESALATSVPDAKLLVVQTATSVTSTATPVWAYLFGSPQNDMTYIVYASNGKVMGTEQYGQAGLTAAQWAQVPGLDKWKIDSDAAYRKALAASGAKGTPEGYVMGFLTYSPSPTSTVQPFVWNVAFQPGTSGATTATIEVNASTGDTKVTK